MIDRGDLANPATRLPILDGGFDQKQIVFGVVRHIEGKQPSSSDYDGGGAIESGALRGNRYPGWVATYPRESAQLLGIIR